MPPSADRFKPYAPDGQAVVRLDEALPSEHPVQVFVDLVRSIDLGHFVVTPGPKGEKPYHPHALFGVLAWGYLHGVRSSRKLARLARQEAAFVYLAGGSVNGAPGRSPGIGLAPPGAPGRIAASHLVSVPQPPRTANGPVPFPPSLVRLDP